MHFPMRLHFQKGAFPLAFPAATAAVAVVEGAAAAAAAA
eukprot:CAMPEP_0183588574 /NCGR_PEP_ID=MMETSP0371-20130417/161040_1 /TAXON_ID=268820 /ORGANISM="Peridinium aciculiferum, Strain PAER-2" /LENGTH=38 /DNA_ID= /DNA_START= /DNA_END= /DNA_ORIENTATION=